MSSDGARTPGGSEGRPAGRPGGAHVVSGAEKKSFDRGGPVWPPRSNVTNDRLRGGVWGSFAPQAKNRGVWGAAPPSEKLTKKLTGGTYAVNLLMGYKI